MFLLKGAHLIIPNEEVFHFHNVHINDCNFTHKDEYNGHGAVITYSPNINGSTQHKLLFHNNQFIFSRASRSVVYKDDSGSRIQWR